MEHPGEQPDAVDMTRCDDDGDNDDDAKSLRSAIKDAIAQFEKYPPTKPALTNRPRRPKQPVYRGTPVSQAAHAKQGASQPAKRLLSGKILHKAIRDALRTAIKKQNTIDPKRPLNGKQQVLAAMRILREQGITSRKGIKRHVEEIAEQFKADRRRIGTRVFEG